MAASLIINSPYIAPARHWQQARDGSLALVESRRPASYEIFDIRNNTRRTGELERIGEIRGRVASVSGAGMWFFSRRRFRTFLPGTDVAGRESVLVTRRTTAGNHDDSPQSFGELASTLQAAATPLLTAPSSVAG